jgi:hypothetical protein
MGYNDMKLILNKFAPALLLLCIMLVTQSCTTLSSGSRADYAIPGCERAWDSIARANGLKELKTLVVNDCSIMYQKGWRLPINKNKGGVNNPELCDSAWNNLDANKQLDNTKFMITHNCPVFYRHDWVIPPN